MCGVLFSLSILVKLLRQPCPGLCHPLQDTSNEADVSHVDNGGDGSQDDSMDDLPEMAPMVSRTSW